MAWIEIAGSAAALWLAVVIVLVRFVSGNSRLE